MLYAHGQKRFRKLFLSTYNGATGSFEIYYVKRRLFLRRKLLLGGRP